MVTVISGINMCHYQRPALTELDPNCKSDQTETFSLWFTSHLCYIWLASSKLIAIVK